MRREVALPDISLLPEMPNSRCSGWFILQAALDAFSAAKQLINNITALVPNKRFA